MKTKVIILISLFISSCTSVYFETPLPTDGKEMNKFPRKFQAKWLNLSDKSDTIEITKHAFITKTTNIIKLPKQKLDTLFFIKNNKLYMKDTAQSVLKYGANYKLINDSLVFQTTETEIHHLLYNNHLRKTKNFYFANFRNKDNWWEIFAFRITANGQLIILSPNKKELQKLKNIEIIDTLNYKTYVQANINKKELNQLVLKHEFFSDTLAVLSKISKN